MIEMPAVAVVDMNSQEDAVIATKVTSLKVLYVFETHKTKKKRSWGNAEKHDPQRKYRKWWNS